MSGTEPAGAAHGPAPSPWTCERCGYPIDPAAPGQVCPECALPHCLSDPARRRGSDWQQAQTLRKWLATTIAMVARPRRTLATIRVDGRSDLFFVNVAFMPLLAVPVFWVLAVGLIVWELLSLPDAPTALKDADVVSAIMLSFLLPVFAGTVATLVWFAVTGAAAGLALLSIRVLQTASAVRRSAFEHVAHASCVLVPSFWIVLACLAATAVGIDRSGRSFLLSLAAGLAWFIVGGVRGGTLRQDPPDPTPHTTTHGDAA